MGLSFADLAAAFCPRGMGRGMAGGAIEPTRHMANVTERGGLRSKRGEDSLSDILRQRGIAHRVLVVPGYLFALAGAACFYYYELELPYTLACVVMALLFAACIFFKKPLSRHHAAFISVAVLFVIVFGALYYFPTLRHGT